jgi:hypothetical protein
LFGNGVIVGQIGFSRFIDERLAGLGRPTLFCSDCVKLQKLALRGFGKKAIGFRQIKGLDVERFRPAIRPCPYCGGRRWAKNRPMKRVSIIVAATQE